jgi:hypothetical protein
MICLLFFPHEWQPEGKLDKAIEAHQGQIFGISFSSAGKAIAFPAC